ncbi:hypothetical protein Tco_0780177 [Tanacetum coccineum]
MKATLTQSIGVNKDEVLSMVACMVVWKRDIPFNFLGLSIGSYMKGCGTRIRFWKDIWVGETPLLQSWYGYPAISCPSCNANVESANHVFFECDIATDMWKLVFRWCDIPLFQASSWDSFNDWIISWHASKEKKHKFYVITTSGSLWALEDRNSVTCNSHTVCREE